jgi:hypothetical protein
MALKWVSALVAVAAGSSLLAMAMVGAAIPVAAAAGLAAACVSGVVLLVLAELHRRLDARISLLSDFLVVRLDDVVARLDHPSADHAAALAALLRADPPEQGGNGTGVVLPLVPRKR